MLSLETVSVVIIGYLLGSIPFGVLVAKKMGVDIYSVGSGNPGATNVLRSIGKPAGYTVFLLDFLKGILATVWFNIGFITFTGDSNLLALWGLPAAVLGHTYPLFSNFKGGKGVATAMGGLLGVMPGCLLIGLVVFIIAFHYRITADNNLALCYAITRHHLPSFGIYHRHIFVHRKGDALPAL